MSETICINNLLLLIAICLQLQVCIYLEVSSFQWQKNVYGLPHYLFIYIAGFLPVLNFCLSEWSSCQSTSLNLFLPSCLDRLLLWQSLCPSPHCTSFDPSLLCLGPSCLRVSQQDPRLSMQPVMRCMLQSACEELIRKQQRPSHINRHERVCLRVWVGRVWGWRASLAHLTAVCRPTGVLICRGKGDRDEFWSTKGLCGACLNVLFISFSERVCVEQHVCEHGCEHVYSLCFSDSPRVHHVHTNERFGYAPLLSGLLLVGMHMWLCVCVSVWWILVCEEWNRQTGVRVSVTRLRWLQKLHLIPDSVCIYVYVCA